MSEIKVDTIGPRVDNGTLTIGASGDTVNIAGTAGTGFPTPTSGIAASAIDSGTIATARLGSGTASSSTFLRGDQTYAAPASASNAPYFLARRGNTGQTVANDSYVTIVFDTEMLDSAGTYNPATGLWTPGVIGKYFVFANVCFSVNAGSVFNAGTIIMDKNSAGYTDTNFKGSITYLDRRSGGSSASNFYVSQIVDLDADDTMRIQFQGTWPGSSSNETLGYGKTYFGGYKLA